MVVRDDQVGPLAADVLQGGWCVADGSRIIALQLQGFHYHEADSVVVLDHENSGGAPHEAIAERKSIRNMASRTMVVSLSSISACGRSNTCATIRHGRLA